MDVTFIDDGPGIPEELLREHEEGKVVFFCGAGVSCAAGLPSFSGLVKSVAKRLRLFDDQIKEEWLNERYDYALGKLEEIAPGKRREIRSIVHQILTSFKKNTRPNTETHDVLIRLATTRETGHCHLVTTNFDRLFEKAISSDSNFESYTAPLLPIPRDGIWNGIVYLHGLAPESFDEFAMDKLVYSNRDFGKAYLTDGWAARFTTELLKNYTLCFVGYSLSDPLLRYLVDALPAENSHKVYTFADYNHGKFPREKVKSQWESKHVIPILFDADSCGGHYHALHMTLKKWAAVYEADFNAKEQIIKTDAIRDPVTNSKTDDFVDRVIWALKDKSGIPALTFSQMAPTPNVGWLPKLQDAGLLDIPLPPSLQITRHYEPELNLLGAARPLSHWILHHLNNPRLLSWFVENGFSLLAHFRFLLAERLHTIENMSADSLAAEKKNFPDCIPQKEYLWAWRLVANGCVSSHQQGSPLRDLATVHDLTDQHDLTASDHVSLREKLTPRIEISKNFSFEKILVQERHPPFFKLFSVDLVLRDNCIHSILHTYSNKLPPKRRIEILPDLEYALKTGLDLATEANGGKLSFIEAGFSLPSIEDSDQNLAVKEWSELVHAIAKGWVDLDRSKPAEAALMATRWHGSFHPIFRRLAFFAAANGESIPQATWLDWLTEHDGEALVNGNIKREVHRLIDRKSKALTLRQACRLCKSIIQSRETSKSKDVDEDNRTYWENRRKFFLLSKIHIQLPIFAQKELTRIHLLHPEFKVDKYHREEFSGWVTGTGHPDYEESKKLIPIPTTVTELVEWLKLDIGNKWNDDHFYKVPWGDFCKSNPDIAEEALAINAKKGPLNTNRWNEILWAWRDKGTCARMVRLLRAHFSQIDEKELIGLKHALSSWTEHYSEQKDCDNELIREIASRILQYELSSTDNPLCADLKRDIVTASINHPAGLAVSTLLRSHFAGKREKDEGLPAPLRKILEKCCQGATDAALYAKNVIMAWNSAIYYVDRAWFRTNLIPLLDWDKDPQVATSAWQGLLRSGHPYNPLVEDIKNLLLNTVSHYDQLGSTSTSFCVLALRTRFFKLAKIGTATFRKFFDSFPLHGYEELTHVLHRTQADTMNPRKGEKGDPKFWDKYIKPFFLELWPNRPNIITEKVSQEIISLISESNTAFPDAFKTLQNYIRRPEYPDSDIYIFKGKGLCGRFPKEACLFLNQIIGTNVYCGETLRECLDEIKSADTNIVRSAEYKRLDRIARQHGN